MKPGTTNYLQMSTT